MPECSTEISSTQSLRHFAIQESTQEFYDRSIRDERGQVRQVAGCVSRVREVLQIEENRFQGFVEQIVAAVRTGQVCLTEVSGRDQGVLDLIGGWWLQIGDRVAESADVHEQFVRRMYIYSSYVVHRACEYAARDTIKIDPNDFEDARFCLHLGLDAGTTVVTGDTGLRRCLEAAVETLNAMADGSRHSSLRVCDTTAFSRDHSGSTLGGGVAAAQPGAAPGGRAR